LVAGCTDDKLSNLETGDAGAGSDDAQAPNSGTTDSGGVADAAAADTGAMDAGTADSGAPDSGPEDAGFEDASAPDATADAGTVDAGDDGIMVSDQFPLGIASGDVTTDAAILWTRYTGNHDLHVVLRDAGGNELIDEAVTIGSGGFVHYDATVLSAGDRYSFTFYEVDAQQRIARAEFGRFRAAIADTAVEPVVIGSCCCTSNSMRAETLEHAGARTDIDTFLLLGDTTYNDGAQSLGEYRDMWTSSIEREGYLALRRSTSLMATWDDHEVDNNWNPERIDGGQLTAATRAMFDNLPIRRQPANPDRLWKSIRWGHTVEIFVLDCRGERKPSTKRMPSAEYVSVAQMDWLKAGLQASPARFKLIMNSVPIADLPGLFDFAGSDRWEGYSTQRDEVVTFIDDNMIEGVVWLAGDIHLVYRGRLAESGPGSTQLEVLAGPGAQVPNPLSPVLRARPNQFDWASGANNYLVMHFDPMSGEVRTVHHDRSDSIISDHTYSV